jgi:hypothetical protein
MARKTLRGKRHIRARRSVAFGRRNRQWHKMQREMAGMKNLIAQLPILIPQIVDGLRLAAQAIVDYKDRILAIINSAEFAEKFEEKLHELQKVKNDA